MIEVENLTRRFGATTAVDGLSFRAEDGRVTGFLGPNGSGKTTTMRVVLGLDRPGAGRARIDGAPLRAHRSPLRTVGAVLDADSAAPGMSARAHLRWVAAAGAIPDRRVDEVLGAVGLDAVAGRRVGAMSLGMRARLGLATALLGDPHNLVLDEPVNGLDPEGVHWARGMLRRLADDGRAVLVSSHLIAEMQQTADQVVVIGRGRLMADIPMAGLDDTAGRVRVRAADPDGLVRALRRGFARIEIERPDPGGPVLWVRGPAAEQIGDAAAASGIAVHELTPQRATLEEVFLRLTHETSEYVASDPPTAEIPTTEMSGATP